MTKESAEFINLALCVSMHQFPESCVMWSAATERYNRLGNVQKRIKEIIKAIQTAQDNFCTRNALETIVFTLEIDVDLMGLYKIRQRMKAG